MIVVSLLYFMSILLDHLAKINNSIACGRKLESESIWNRQNLEELRAQMKGKLIVT